jgi:hypothetical protein
VWMWTSLNTFVSRIAVVRPWIQPRTVERTVTG